MTRQGAERAVVVAALVVAATYAYRVVTEGQSTAPSGGPAQLIGVGPPPNVGRFVTGWGFSFLVISIIAEVSPPLGGWLAILVATGDALANLGQVSADVNTKLGTSTGKAAAPPSSTSSPRQGGGAAVATPGGAVGQLVGRAAR